MPNRGHFRQAAYFLPSLPSYLTRLLCCTDCLGRRSCTAYLRADLADNVCTSCKSTLAFLIHSFLNPLSSNLHTPGKSTTGQKSQHMGQSALTQTSSWQYLQSIFSPPNPSLRFCTPYTCIPCDSKKKLSTSSLQETRRQISRYQTAMSRRLLPEHTVSFSPHWPF